MIEQIGVDWISFFEFATVVFLSASKGKIIWIFPVELGELLKRVVAMHVFVARYLFEKATPNDFVAFFLAGRAPGALNTAECLLEARQGFLSTFATNFDL